jgi:hypothetical protein
MTHSWTSKARRHLRRRAPADIPQRRSIPRTPRPGQIRHLVLLAQHLPPLCPGGGMAPVRRAEGHGLGAGYGGERG